MTITDAEVEAAKAWFDANFNGLPDTETLVSGILLAASQARALSSGDVVVEIEGLIDASWDIAFVEGESGRTTDTPDGRAQETRSAISRRLAMLSARPHPPSKDNTNE